MPERCHNCGAELYAGQQFCRRCGAQVGQAAAAAGEAPTQLFPAGAQTGAAPRAGTSPLGGGRTDAVAQPRPTAYQPPLASFQQTSPLPAGTPVAPKRRRGAWLAALLVVFVLGAGLASAGAYLWLRSTPRRIVYKKVTGAGHMPHAPAAPAVPHPPADLGNRVREALEGAGVPLPVDETGASISGEETVLTRAYDLDESASLAVRGVSGSVTVVGSGEGERATVRIVKRGGSVRERAGARVLLSQSEEGLAFISATPPNGRVSISYEIRVPRGLRQLEVSVDRGDVRITDFAGAVDTDVKAGEVEFRGVAGRVRSKLLKGETRVFHAGAEREGAQEFTVVKGDIEATVADGANADLRAETLDGDIEVAAGLGLRVEKAPAGRHVAGRLGGGGEALLFKVTDGDIRLKR